MIHTMAHPLHDPRYQILAKLLGDLRKQHGLLQQDVAEKLGRPQAFVSKYESGVRRLDLVEFLEIAVALGADPIEVMRKFIALTGVETTLPR